MPHSRLLQRLAQQMDVVGRPAPAPGLEEDEGHPVRVVPAALEGVDELADHQNGGVAGVVMDIFEPRLRDPGPAGLQQLHLVAGALHHLADELEVHGQHIGHQDGVGLFHLLSEDDVAFFLVGHRVGSFRSKSVSLIFLRHDTKTLSLQVQIFRNTHRLRLTCTPEHNSRKLLCHRKIPVLDTLCISGCFLWFLYGRNQLKIDKNFLIHNRKY